MGDSRAIGSRRNHGGVCAPRSVRQMPAAVVLLVFWCHSMGVSGDLLSGATQGGS